MQKKWLATIGSGVLIAGLALAGPGFANSEEEIHNGTIQIRNQAEADYPAFAKVSFEQAVTTARNAVPGQVLKAELEDEDGFLVYGIEVVTGDKSVMEVAVDAGSGKVLATSKDKVDNEEHDRDQRDRNREDED